MLSLLRKRRKRPKRARPGTGLKTQLQLHVEEQARRGIPRQEIYNDLMAKSRAALNDSSSPSPHLEANAVGTSSAMSVAGEVRHVMMERNRQATHHEKEGQVDRAIRLYEANLTDGFEGMRPYERLRLIYTRQNRYQEAIRICQAYLALPERECGQSRGQNRGQNKETFRQHLQRLQDQIT